MGCDGESTFHRYFTSKHGSEIPRFKPARIHNGNCGKRVVLGFDLTKTNRDNELVANQLQRGSSHYQHYCWLRITVIIADHIWLSDYYTLSDYYWVMQTYLMLGGPSHFVSGGCECLPSPGLVGYPIYERDYNLGVWTCLNHLVTYHIQSEASSLSLYPIQCTILVLKNTHVSTTQNLALHLYEWTAKKTVGSSPITQQLQQRQAEWRPKVLVRVLLAFSALSAVALLLFGGHERQEKIAVYRETLGGSGWWDGWWDGWYDIWWLINMYILCNIYIYKFS